MKTFYLPLLLLIALCTLPAVSAKGGIGDCCREIKRTIIRKQLLSSYYTQSTQSCAIPALVFYTVKDKRICADPSAPWTQRSVAFLDAKNI